jgi:murein L,D-transpeptidase YcbB/YkuD
VINVRFSHSAVLAALAVIPLTASWAQNAAPGDPIAPLPEAAQPAAPVELPPPPPPLWQPGQAQVLLAYIRQVGRDGLSPQDYGIDELEAGLRSGDPLTMSAAATESFNKLASDLALGHVRGDSRIGWHIVDNDIDPDRRRQLLDTALRDNRIPDALNGLLPAHPQYGALKTALSITPRTDAAKYNRIRLNMDRWRWLPRELGQRYIIVNVPSYYATLVENGATRWKTRAVAGAIKTPTPQLTATAVGVILNPWWEVPTSISKEVAGKPGYVAVKGKDGKVQRWRQPPGPSNALGQLKFVMYNPQNIYLHDTNARSRFDSRMRSLSHGCIRTKNVVGLAKTLFAEEGNERWSPEKVDEVLASRKTVQADFDKPIPVYIVYFSSAAATDGRLINYEDVYRRDAKVLAALNDTLPAKVAKPKAEVASR